ncbi:MBOAT family O-acyltransferase [Oscillatoria salina]|uniref:MBOAT family O-acyltransferase n=1 Tax=Oscillatoria salina TaxID=331517 RepID=UPI0013B79491|nr:MBOAT family protein [Oscillatoria salina]MBZ8179326.1 MBOAT family protein [Oscillatoria salina IIICB1]NET87640.1 MBOAT family protein [Kamptonema sp. SIO1D9]
MTFVSNIYALFLLILLIIYWSVGRALAKNSPKKSQHFQLWLLLIASIIFYASLQWWYIPLLLAITLINFFLARTIESQSKIGGIQAENSQLSNQQWEQLQGFWNRRTSNLLWLGIILNVLLLVGFKYIPFILNSLAAPLNLSFVTQSATWISDRVIAPLGLSFFTFECIAYLIDVYRGAPAARQLLQFTSYKLFFPKLISGPITRFHHFTSQHQLISFDESIEGLWLIASGAFKKALLADNLAIYVDLCYGNLERAGSGDLWLATLAYGLQLYFDFSGYVDIVRGSALLLGFNLPENFDFPYFTTSIADFWRRWHMTLGNWLRNYLYFPLGGSRRGLGRTCLNLFVIMLIAGIWHGAAWGYVVWGALHGIALALHRLTETFSKRWQWISSWWQSFLGIMFAWILTQIMVFTSWVWFRLPNLEQATLVFQHYWNYSGDIQFAQKVYAEALNLQRYRVALLIAGLISSMSIIYFVQRGLKLQLNWTIKLILVPLCLYCVWILAPEGGLPYIYFDF